MSALTQVLESVFTRGNVLYLLQGLFTTLFVALISVFLSMILGTGFALLRTYGNMLFRVISSVYIEIFRNTPHLLWVFAIRFLVRIPPPFDAPVYSGILSFTLFTTAGMAEIIRGGLNAIPPGQFEGAYSQGFRFPQTLRLIILPQCYRSILPAMLSQVITVIKDTSFLAQVAIQEFFNNSKWIMSAQADSSVDQTLRVFVIFGFVSLIYFIMNVTLSHVVRSQKKNRLEIRY